MLILGSLLLLSVAVVIVEVGVGLVFRGVGPRKFSGSDSLNGS